MILSHPLTEAIESHNTWIRNRASAHANAARRQLANRGLRDVVAAWEREHGAFSDEELATARALTDG